MQLRDVFACKLQTSKYEIFIFVRFSITKREKSHDLLAVIVAVLSPRHRLLLFFIPYLI